MLLGAVMWENVDLEEIILDVVSKLSLGIFFAFLQTHLPWHRWPEAQHKLMEVLGGGSRRLAEVVPTPPCSRSTASGC